MQPWMNARVYVCTCVCPHACMGRWASCEPYSHNHLGIQTIARPTTFYMCARRQSYTLGCFHDGSVRRVTDEQPTLGSGVQMLCKGICALTTQP